MLSPLHLVAWVQDQLAPAAPSDDAAIDEKERALEKSIGEKTVPFADLVVLRNAQTPSGPRPEGWHRLGDRFLDRATEAFKMAHGGTRTRLALFGECAMGAYLTPMRTSKPGREYRWTVVGRVIPFDWSEAQRLLHRLDAVEEQAQTWWGATASAGESDGGGYSDAQLSPHLERVYSHATLILSAVNRESIRRRVQGAADDEPPAKELGANLAVLRIQVERAEALLAASAQLAAQSRYARGMLLGTLLLGIGCAAIGGAFVIWDVPAWYAVAFPAGALGALVSVLQRMTSGSLRLDSRAGRGMLTTYGMIRPLVGAVFGMALFVLTFGGILPAIQASQDAPLAFYTGAGFLAGFNERFAQDMLAGSASQLGTHVAFTQPAKNDAHALAEGVGG